MACKVRGRITRSLSKAASRLFDALVCVPFAIQPVKLQARFRLLFLAADGSVLLNVLEYWMKSKSDVQAYVFGSNRCNPNDQKEQPHWPFLQLPNCSSKLASGRTLFENPPF